MFRTDTSVDVPRLFSVPQPAKATLMRLRHCMLIGCISVCINNGYRSRAVYSAVVLCAIMSQRRAIQLAGGYSYQLLLYTVGLLR